MITTTSTATTATTTTTKTKFTKTLFLIIRGNITIAQHFIGALLAKRDRKVTQYELSGNTVTDTISRRKIKCFVGYVKRKQNPIRYLISTSQ